MALYENRSGKHVRFPVRGVGDRMHWYDVAPGGTCEGPEVYREPFRREGLVLVAAAPEPACGCPQSFPPGIHEPGCPAKPNGPPPRQDGPTLEEFVAAGYQAENYPPPGYAEKQSPGLDALRALRARQPTPAELRAEARTSLTADPESPTQQTGNPPAAGAGSSIAPAAGDGDEVAAAERAHAETQPLPAVKPRRPAKKGP